MTCIKTGCHVYLTEYGVFARGDAHKHPFVSTIDEVDYYVFRLTPTSDVPLDTQVHYTIHAIDDWFERGTNPSTLLTRKVTEHNGYDGISLEQWQDQL